MWKTASLLIGIVLVLLAVGIVMLASTSAARADAVHGNPNHFVLLQFRWIGIGLIVAAVAARLDYHILRGWALPLFLLTLVLLVMVLVPGVGIAAKGSSRWLRFGPVNMQPSEIAKFSLVLFLAWWMMKAQRRLASLAKGFAPPALALAAVLGLVLRQPDYGTTLLLAAIGGVMMLFGGFRPRHVLVSGALGGAAFAWAVMNNPLRLSRITSFLERERYAEGESYQLMQAIYAFAAGGARGAGLGDGLQKRFYLPEAHTDFIFAIIGEELGAAATLGVLALFAGLCACGLATAARAPDPFGRFLAFGLTLSITLQALINIGVVTGCLPTTGLALPFISYGGSSLVVALGMVGVLINIALHAAGRIADEDTRAVKDRLRRF